MLLHQEFSNYVCDLICPLHGEQCPQEIGHKNQYRPIYDDKKINYFTSVPDLLKITKSTCPITAAFARIAIIRRQQHVESKHFYINQNKDDDQYIAEMRNQSSEFPNFIKQHVWYLLNKANVRILISILETYAELQTTKEAALAAITLIRMERIARMASVQKDELIRKEFGIVYGFKPECTPAPDSVMNLFYRMRASLFQHPVLWLIFYKIVQYELESDDHTFKRCDNLEYYKIYDFAKSSMVDYATKFLRPSTVNIRYWNLYCKQHQTSQYGGGSDFPSREQEFLKNNNCKSIIDFGCGQGNRNGCGFIWTKYDPCIPKFWDMPQEPKDGLICYDVLEHVPENELNIVAEWIDLLSKKCIVLGIATKPAQTILDNGENAHCTVKTSEWWENWAKNIFKYETKRFQSQSKSFWSGDNYVILHIKKS